MAKRKSETEQEVSRFIKILIGVIIVVLGVYLFTNAFVSEDNDVKKNSSKGEIDSTKIIVGSILNRVEDEYYVLAYKSKDLDAALFNSYIYLYNKKEDALSIYTVDLDNKLNESYYSEETNVNIDKISDIKLSSPTLLKIKSNKIEKSFTEKDSIKSELGIN